MGSSARLVGEAAIIPRPMLVGVGLALVLAIACAGAARRSGAGIVTMPATAAVSSRDLRFEDLADRSVAVRDAATGALVATVPPKTGGFLRGVMRGLLYDYRYNRDTAEVRDHAFHLTQWADGRLSLEDATTHQRIELEAFGSSNSAVFARFLPNPG